MKMTIERIGRAVWIPPRRLRRTLRYWLGLRRRYVESGWWITDWVINSDGDEGYSIAELVAIAAKAGTLDAPAEHMARIKAV